MHDAALRPEPGQSQSAPHFRREVLIRLRRGGPTSPDQLAAGLGASRTGVLQQLRALEAAGLVTRQTVRHGVGRPRHLYDVTPMRRRSFPSNYDGLAAGLLDAITRVGGEALVEGVFAARRAQARGASSESGWPSGSRPVLRSPTGSASWRVIQDE